VGILDRTRAQRTTAAVVILAMAAGVPLTFAVLHTGFPITDVTVDARTVWVTDSDHALAGRLNRQIDELTASVSTLSSQIDVFQDGDTVFLHDAELNTLERIDPALATLAETTPVPVDAQISLGGSSLAILDPATGDLWVVDASGPLDFDPASTSADVTLGAGAHTVAGRTGVVYGSSPENGTLTVIASAGATPDTQDMEIPVAHQLSVVGDTAVVLDEANSVLLTAEGTRTELGAVGIRLQQPGDARDSVLISTGDALLDVPLDGGDPVVIPAEIAALTLPEDVSAPVWLDGCAHAAWSGAERYLQQCDGGEVVRATIEQPTRGAILEFRVNRRVIVLNNLQNGNTWVPASTLRLVENWDEVIPSAVADTEEGDEQSTQQSYEDTLASRTDINRVPVATDDSFGVRAGRTTVLPVLGNDTDPDGDVLVVSDYTALDPAVGTLDLIDGGRALQVTPTAAGGSAAFVYTVDDGREGTAQAQASITVVPAETNRAPAAVRASGIGVEPAQTIGYNVLGDWIDPDGDALILTSASAAGGDTVRFTPDGLVTFQNTTGGSGTSGGSGTKTVAVVVSDGTLETAGEMSVNVSAAGSTKPVATPDYAEAFVGETIVLTPLANDLSPSGARLDLVSIDAVPSTATVTMNRERATISASSTVPGALYFTYALGAGDQAATGLVRVEVKPNSVAQLQPIAVADVAYLREGESTTVPLLANDVSPSGQVLSVQSIDTSTTNPAVTVELIGNAEARLTSTGAVTEQTGFSYTVSDGTQTATTAVTVVPVAPVIDRQPPVAVDDRVTVRAGDISRATVLTNDYHPDDARISLEPTLICDTVLCREATSAGSDSLAFVSADTVRFQAPADAGEYPIGYRIVDQFGETATATVTFVVTAPDSETNAAPVAVRQTARTFAGSTVRINIPLDGIDPNGDSVTLAGIVTAPTGGRIIEQGPTWFVYEAYNTTAGSDTFRYQLEDSNGARALGDIVVGVIPRGETTAAPTAVDDTIELRPGTSVSVPVLLNDSDPGGFTLRLAKDLLDVDAALEARVVGSTVVVDAPDTEGSYSLRYQTDNGEGGIDTAVVHVTVTPTAQPVSPTAADYYIEDSELDGAEPVVVDLQSLINNPSGLDSVLRITSVGPNAEGGVVDQARGTLTVVPGDTRRAVAYTVTDPTDETLTATAFVVVPRSDTGLNAPLPFLRTDLPEQIVAVDGAIDWNIADLLTVPSGGDVVITDATTVRATNGNGTPLFVDSTTLHFEPAEGFSGQTDVVFEVTDAADAGEGGVDAATGDDLAARTALITLPVTVGETNPNDADPEFTPVSIDVEAGGDPRTVDLRAAASHPNADLLDAIVFDNLEGVSGGIVATLDGSDLSVSAPAGVAAGTTATLTLTLTSGETVVPASVTVTVVASARPLAQAVTDEQQAQRGRAATTNVLSNDIDPFVGAGDGAGDGLRLVDAVVENATESEAEVTFTENGEVSVTPSAAFLGVISVVYTVEDATGESSRRVQGRYLVTVRDIPDQPAAPTIVAEGDGSVTIAVTAPATNGEPILDYTVTWAGGSVVLPATSAGTTIDSLTNGSAYTFRVSAQNTLGRSTVSDASAVARPFGAPAAPASASLSASTDGTGTVTLQWAAAAGNGRDVASYRWTLSDGTSGEVPGDELSVTVPGEVGSAYRFSVVAVDTAGNESLETPNTGSVTPTPGVAAPARVSVDGGGSPTVTLSWGEAATTGAIDRYEISINGGVWTSMGAELTHVVDGTPGTTYRFLVRAVDGTTTGPDARSTAGTVPR